MNLEISFAEIAQKFDSCNEWLLIHASGKSFALKRSEIEIELGSGKILLSFLDEKGFQIWRVKNHKIENEKLAFELTRNFERESEKVQFVPRISTAELSETVELARLEKANQIANLIVAENPRSKLVRVSLNEENGRTARIVFENSQKKHIAALADVFGVAVPENLLVSAILWLAKLEMRQKNPINTIWILAETKLYKNLRKLHALMAENWKSKIVIKEVARQKPDASTEEIIERPALSLKTIWREKPFKISSPESSQISKIADEIVKIAPESIDSIFTKHGETLRFEGLPFARIRKFGATERCWFGIEREKRILNEISQAEFFNLVKNLRIYRRFDSPNKRHDFFRLAPEAWLEAILRRNINLLDGNLILSPIHNQFRAGSDKIDLLALRTDGRLIVIELKVETDREIIFQAVDYWRKIELQRRSRNLQKAKIFGDLEIADKPAIVYLVAPTLSFHRDFDFLSRIIAPEIEIFRFDLNENWRENLKVMKVSKC